MGHKPTSTTPYGWLRDPDRPAFLLEDEIEQDIIAKMIALQLIGLSYYAIARELDEQGVPARGLVWHRSTVRRALLRVETG